MSANKHISKIIIALTTVAVLLCFVAIAYADELNEVLGGTGVKMEYESALFDTDEVMEVNIIIDDEDWETMLTNAMSEEYYVCDVVINGEKVNNVAIRPKGNTSLSSIAMDPDTDRYSLKLEFDHFVDGQTCYGLDKLILNSNYADATNMKEAIIYDMYQFLGADASLYNYAAVYVNGEYWGVYLALEGVEDSFMLRNFGTQDGDLYKPESMGIGGGGEDGESSGAPSMPGGDFSDMDLSNIDFSDKDFSQFEGMTPPDGGDDGFEFDAENMPDMGDFDPSEMGGSSMGGSGADLNYTDDDLSSYSTIWEGEVTGTGSADHRRVVTALKNISEGTDLEEYLNVDNILRYMAVHTFAVNMDSLSGMMAHNYYLYEYDGQLNIFPWDYNLSFGGYEMDGSGDGTSMINDAIDTPFGGTDFFDALLENEEYLEIYHSYLQSLVDEYVYGGRFDETYNRIRSQIDSLVETDPTAFYTYDEYVAGADMLYDVIKLRAESIDGQLDGTIPSTDAGQNADSSSLIDGSDIDVAVMGVMNMGGGFGGGPAGGFGGSQDGSSDQQPGQGAPDGQMPSGDMPSDMGTPTDGAQMPEGMPGDMGDFDPGNMPDGFDPSNMQGGATGGMPSDFSTDENVDNDTAVSDDSSSESEGQRLSFGDSDQATSFPGMTGMNISSTTISNLVTYGICFLVVIIAVIVIGRTGRKSKR